MCSIPCYGGAPAPFIGAPGLLPVLVQRRGYHMATTVGSTVHSCLGVHERGPWAQKLRPQQRGRRPSRTASCCRRGAGGVPTVTSRLARSAGLLPYHQRGKHGGLRRCPRFVDSFITKVGL